MVADCRNSGLRRRDAPSLGRREAYSAASVVDVGRGGGRCRWWVLVRRRREGQGGAWELCGGARLRAHVVPEAQWEDLELISEMLVKQSSDEGPLVGGRRSAGGRRSVGVVAKAAGATAKDVAVFAFAVGGRGRERSRRGDERWLGLLPPLLACRGGSWFLRSGTSRGPGGLGKWRARVGLSHEDVIRRVHEVMREKARGTASGDGTVGRVAVLLGLVVVRSRVEVVGGEVEGVVLVVNLIEGSLKGIVERPRVASARIEPGGGSRVTRFANSDVGAGGEGRSGDPLLVWTVLEGGAVMIDRSSFENQKTQKTRTGRSVDQSKFENKKRGKIDFEKKEYSQFRRIGFDSRAAGVNGGAPHYGGSIRIDNSDVGPSKGTLGT